MVNKDEYIAFENGRISDFQGLVTLTLDRVILHTVMHHSSTSTYIPNFTEIEESFCGHVDGHLRRTLLGLVVLQVFLWLCRHDVHQTVQDEMTLHVADVDDDVELLQEVITLEPTSRRDSKLTQCPRTVLC